MLRLLLLLSLLMWAGPQCGAGRVEENRDIERQIMHKYERRHRPVKRESSTTTVRVFIVVNHIEEVNEHEQTMVVHGMLWAQWYDEYLTWDPKNFSNTDVINIQPWKIWQPSFALYNSARTNNWYLYMNGLPATVYSTGRVSAIGAFTFHVTCVFDFAKFPNDVQSCPIVIADWVYDLAKVNLTNSGLLPRPVVRLSTNPFDSAGKKHVSGWEVIDSWQSQCNYGPNGCEDVSPGGPYQLDNYWSLLEFGIVIKRHAPYFFATATMPLLASVCLSLFVFWIENLPQAALLSLFSIMLQAVSGWTMMRQMPPGNGKVPHILVFYGCIFVWNTTIFFFHTVLTFVLDYFPHDVELPFRLTNLSEQLRKWKAFNTEGFSFDTQAFLLSTSASRQNSLVPNNHSVEQDLLNPEPLPAAGTHSPASTIEMEPLEAEGNHRFSYLEFEPEVGSSATDASLTDKVASASNSAAPNCAAVPPPIVEQEAPKRTRTHLEEELYTLRRMVFFGFLLVVVVLMAVYL